MRLLRAQNRNCNTQALDFREVSAMTCVSFNSLDA